MKNVEFISYSGRWPALCSGILCMEVAGKVHTFGYGERWWESGGSCWYANGETGHNTGPWRLNKNYLPAVNKHFQHYIIMKEILNAN